MREEEELVTAQEVPLCDREAAILTGYRRALSYTACLRSVFRIHNETVNIWTHLLGFLFFLWLLLDTCLRHQAHLRDRLDFTATCLQLLSYQLCMANSAAFHTFTCHSKETKACWLQADHGGILVAFLGTYIRIIVTTLRCFPGHRAAHLAVIFLLFGSVLGIKYGPGKSTNTKVPLCMFFALALYVVVPFTHWIHLSQGLQQPYITLPMVLWMWFPYLVAVVGLGFYLSRWPEVLLDGLDLPGRVDICGASHQIWHVFIFSAMASWHYIAGWVSRQSPLSCQMAASPDDQEFLLSPIV